MTESSIEGAALGAQEMFRRMNGDVTQADFSPGALQGRLDNRYREVLNREASNGIGITVGPNDYSRFGPHSPSELDRTVSEWQITTGSISSIEPEVIIEIIDSNGETKNINIKDLAKDYLNLKNKNEELEARLYKLEEYIRFLNET